MGWKKGSIEKSVVRLRGGAEELSIAEWRGIGVTVEPGRVEVSGGGRVKV